MGIFSIVEIYAYVKFDGMKYGQSKGTFIESEQYEYFFRPNINKTFNDIIEFNTTIVTNSKGLRWKEISYENTKNKKRILFLGDSVTECWGVNIEDCFVYKIEKSMDSELNIEIINAGIRNYGTKLEYNYFINEGVKYDPDYVIIMFSRNDLTDNLQNNSIINGVLNQGNKYSVLQASIFSQIKESYFFNNIYYRVSKFNRKNEFINNMNDYSSKKITNKEFLNPYSEEWNITKEYIYKTNNFCLKNSCKLIIIYAPPLEYYRIVNDTKLDSEEFIIGEILKNITLEKNIKYIDLSYEIYEVIKKEKITFETDFHYNIRGNTVLSEIISPKLEKYIKDTEK